MKSLLSLPYRVLLVGERKRRLVPARSLRFVELLQSLPITLDADVRPLGELPARIGWYLTTGTYSLGR